MTTIVVDVAPSQIKPSPFNHRKLFTGIEELSVSIKEKGLISPVTCRKVGAGLELVVGERRWRASKLAGVTTIPVIVRELDDQSVLEVQLIENVQRADVHPLEEADGYKDLIDKHSYTVEGIAAKIGKSTGYVYARLKLCALGPHARKAFLAGRLVPEIALKIARIPAALQEQATQGVLRELKSWRDYQGSGVRELNLEVEDAKGKTVSEPVPMSVREASVFLQRKFMLRLDQAQFPTADATLVAKAGACTACPKRTGNQAELFSDVRSADVCTDPACFESKKAADWDRKKAAAAKDGLRVLNDKEAKNVFDDYRGTTITHGSAYVDPNDNLPYDLNPTGNKTWKQLLGKDTPASAIALDKSGTARVLFDKKSAIATLEKSGKLKALKRESRARSSSSSSNSYDAQQRKKQAEAKQRHAVARLAWAELAKKATGKTASGVPFFQWLAHGVMRMLDSEDQRNLCKRRELEAKVGTGDSEKILAKLIAETKDADALMALIVEMVSAFRAVGGLWGGKQFGENFTSACALMKVDLAKLKRDVVAGDKAKKSKPAAAAKKATKAK